MQREQSLGFGTWVYSPIVIAAFLLFGSSSQAQAAAPVADEQISAMVKEARLGAVSYDYAALRTRYAASPSFVPTAVAAEPCFTSLRAGDYAGGEAAGKLAVEADFFNVAAHLCYGLSSETQGHPEIAAREQVIFKGFISAILVAPQIMSALDGIVGGRTGATPEAALNAMNIADENALLTMLNFTKVSRVMSDKDGHAYDLVLWMDPMTWRSGGIYFNVDAVPPAIRAAGGDLTTSITVK